MRPEVEKLREWRAAGVKSLTLSGADIQSVEFFEPTADERMTSYVEELTAEEKAAYELLSKDDREQALRERRNSILYHSA